MKYFTMMTRHRSGRLAYPAAHVHGTVNVPGDAPLFESRSILCIAVGAIVMTVAPVVSRQKSFWSIHITDRTKAINSDQILTLYFEPRMLGISGCGVTTKNYSWFTRERLSPREAYIEGTKN